MMRILPEPAVEDLCATSTISQKLVEGAHRASELQKRLPTLPNCAKGFDWCLQRKTSTSFQSTGSRTTLSSSFWAWSLSCRKFIPCLQWNKRSWTPFWRRTCIPDEFALPNLLWQPQYSSSRRRTAHFGWSRTTERSIL